MMPHRVTHPLVTPLSHGGAVTTVVRLLDVGLPFRSRLRVPMVVVTLAFLVAVISVPSPASAQCSVTDGHADESTTNYVGFYAETRQINCTSTTTQVEGWVQGLPTSCEAATGGHCFASNTAGLAHVTMSRSFVCGAFYGRSVHSYVQDSTVTEFANVNTPLWADCPTDTTEYCMETYGSDYWWDGFECTNQVSPILIPTLYGASVHLTSAAAGVMFDIDGNGVPRQ